MMRLSAWAVMVMLLSSAALVSCASGPETATGDDSGRVRIMPDPVPEGEEYPHYMAVRIAAPWDTEGEWVLRAPETLGSDKGLLFIDHKLDHMIPVTHPMAPLEWKRGRDGSLRYRAILDWDVEMEVVAMPSGDELTIEATLYNNSHTDLGDMGHQFCLVQKEVPEFYDGYAERTWIHAGGEFVNLAETDPGLGEGAERPLFIVSVPEGIAQWDQFQEPESWVTQRQADLPLIATFSQDHSNRLVGLAFDNAYKIMTNARIPCIHADPKFPDAKQGETVRVRGKMYFIEGTLDDLLARFYEDFPEWRE